LRLVYTGWQMVRKLLVFTFMLLLTIGGVSDIEAQHAKHMLVGITAVPSMFTPDGDGNQDAVRFEVTVVLEHSPVVLWNLHILDEAGIVVFNQEGRGAVPTTLSWAGEYGREQQYQVVMVLRDQAGTARVASNGFASRIPGALAGAADFPQFKALYFDGDSSSLVPGLNNHHGSNAAALSAVVQFMQQQTATPARLVLVGFANHVTGFDGPSRDREQAESLLPLSFARAESVLNQLLAMGIDRSRLQVQARGGADPAVSSLDVLQRWKNRRVELRLIK